MNEEENKIDYLVECFQGRHPFIIIELPLSYEGKPISDFRRTLMVDKIRSHCRAILIKDYPAVAEKNHTKISYDKYTFEKEHKIVFIK